MKSIILALSALLIIAGCSGGGSSSSTDDPQNPLPQGATSGTLSGKVVDGYIANGHVFADVNANEVEDAGDIVTTTDGDGNVVVPATEVPFNTYIYVTGGTDLATNRPFEGRMSAYYTGTSLIVSPLTTMVATLTKSGQTPEEATASVATALGMPVDKVDADPMEDPEVFFAAQRVVTAVAVFAEHSTDGNVSISSFEAAVTALAENEMDFSAAASDLGVPAVAAEQATAIDDLVQEVEAQVSEAIAAGEDPQFEDVQAIVVSTLDDVVEQIETNPTATVSVPTIDTVNLLYDATSCITFDKIKGFNTNPLEIASAVNITGTDVCETQDDGNVTLTWSSNGAALMSDAGSVPFDVYVGGDVTFSVTITTDAVDTNGDPLGAATKSFALHVIRFSNHLPVANSVTQPVAEDGMVLIDINASDLDVEDTLALTITQAPTHGVAVVVGNQIQYTPTANYNGNDALEYTVTDNWSTPASASAMMNITVSAVDDAPTMVDITDVVVLEDATALSIDINASDIDGDALTYSVVSSDPLIVDATLSGNTMTLTPQPNQFGAVTITATAAANGIDVSKTFTMTLTPVDDAPVLDIVSIAPFDEESTVTTTLNAIDVDGDAIVYSATGYDTSLISVSIVGNEMEVTGLLDQVGITTIDVVATANGVTHTRSVGITINQVDDAPVLSPIADITFDEDTNSGLITLVATDVDNDDSAITYSVSDYNTSLLGSFVMGADVTLSGESNAFGETDVTLSATSNGLSVSQVVHVTVSAIDDAPTLSAISDAIPVDEDSGDLPPLTVHATDVDSDTITYSAVSADPSIATVVVFGDIVTVTTVENASGVVEINVTATADGQSDTKTYDVTINPINDAPVIDGFEHAITTSSTGNSIDIAPHISDVDGDTLSISSFDPVPGLSQVDDTHFSYDSNGSEGLFIFEYIVTDGTITSEPAVITLNVSTTPVLPVAVDDIAEVNEDNTTGVLVDVLANDTDAVSLSIAFAGTLGVATVEGSQLRYIPNANENGIDSITYTAISSTGHEATATVAITITDENDAPTVPTVDEVTVDEDSGNVTVVLAVDDIDNDVASLVVTAVSDEPNVQFVSANATSLELSITPDFNGLAHITVSASDGVDVGQTVFSVTVNQVYDTPEIIALTTVNVDNLGTPEILVALGAIPYNESYTLTATSADTGIASVSVDGSSINVVGNSVGDVIITLDAVNDNDGTLTDTYQFSVHVYDPDAVVPVVSDASVSTLADTIYMDYVVVDTGPVTFSTVDEPLHGTVVWLDDASGQYRYTPSAGYVGTDSFTFKANNGQDSNIGTVAIDVNIASNDDEGYNPEVPMSLTEFNDAPVLTNYNVPMYSVWANYNDNQLQLELDKMVIDDDPQIIIFDDNVSDAKPYTLDTDGATALLDFDGDGSTDLKAKYLGEVNQTALENDLNMTLPAGSLGYKMAILHVTEEYDDWGEALCADYNHDGCVIGTEYTTLEAMMARIQMVNADSRIMYIEAYQFMFSDDDAIGDGSGTLVRVSRNELGEYEVTNASAGTWSVEDVDIDGSTVQYLKVVPSLYGMDSVYTYHVEATAAGDRVMKGSYKAPNQASLEYKYNDVAQAGIANILNASQVSPPQAQAISANEFTGFNQLPTIALPTESFGVWAWTDSGVYTIEEHNITVIDASTVMINGESMAQSTTDNVMTVYGPDSNPFIDLKVVEILNDANVLAAIFDVDSAAFGGSPIAYKTAFIKYNAEFEAWDVVQGVDNTTTYADLTAYVSALQTGDAVVDYTPDGNVISIQDDQGNLALFDGGATLIKANIGTYEFTTQVVDGAALDLIVIETDEPRYGDFNAVAVSADFGNQVAKGRYSAPDTGNIEYRFDGATKEAIVSYITVSEDDFEYEDAIARDGFIGQNLIIDTPLYMIDVNESDALVIEHKVFNANGSLTISDSDGTVYAWASSDGVTAEIEADGSVVGYVRIAETTLDAQAIQLRTGLYMPESVEGYEVAFVNAFDNFDEHFVYNVGNGNVTSFSALVQDSLDGNGGIYLPEYGAMLDFAPGSDVTTRFGEMVADFDNTLVLGSWEIMTTSIGDIMVVTRTASGESVHLYVDPSDGFVHQGRFNAEGEGEMTLHFNELGRVMVQHFLDNVIAP